MNLAVTAATLGNSRWRRRSVPWLGALFIVMIVALAAFDIVRGHRVAVEDTGREMESQARILTEQTARSLQAVDVVQRHVAGEYKRGRLMRLTPDELHTYLRELAVGLVQIDGFGVYDADGNAIALSWAEPLAPGMTNIAELPGFKLMRDDPKVEFGIGRPTQLDGKSWVIPLGRRLETPDGRFAGLVGAPGRIEYFQGFYRDVELERGTTVSLVHLGGTLLARFPASEASLGQPLALYDQLKQRQQPGPVPVVGPDDGVERFAVMRPVPDYPLAVIVTRQADVALSTWRAQSMGTAARTLALGLLASLLLAVVMRQLDRLDAARSSLEASRERFALAVAGSDDGIWDWDRRTDEIFASARARELFGLPPGPESTPREQWFASIHLHPEDIASRATAMDAHMSGETPLYEGEYRVRHPDGTYRWVHVRGLCVRDLKGQPLRMAGSVTDIDARRRAEEDLRLSEERYALAMSGLSGGHWVWEVESDALFVSGTLNELFGLPADTRATTRTAYFAMVTPHPDDWQKLKQIGRDLESGRQTHTEFEYRILLPAGQTRWISTRAQVFLGPDGRAVRIAGVSIDATDRKRTEEALRASEERFALAVAGSDFGVWDWDLNSGLAFESARARELQGLPPGPELQPLDRLVMSLRVHPEDAPRRAEGIRAHLAGETPAYECDYRVLHDDGEYRWIRIRALCIRDGSGRPYRMAGSVSDIDTQRRAEEALRKSEKRFALAVEGTNDGILDWDIVNDQMYASERAMRIAGISAGAVVRTHDEWLALLDIHPDDVPELKQTFRRSPRDGRTTQEGDCRLRQPDGSWRWVRIRGRHLLGADGTPKRWSGSISDIDAHKQTEQALRESEERYELAVAGSNEGMWDWDMRRETFFMSARAQELFGLEPGEPMRPSQEWFTVFSYHPDDEPRVRAALDGYLAGSGAHWEVEYRIQHRRSGEWRWYRERGVALRDAQGKPYRMAGSIEDITPRKSAEAARDRLESQLRQSQKLEAMGTLAGGIAHDFNNILAAILGYGEMAQRDAAEGTNLRRHIDAAMSAGLRAKSLVERILAFSRSGVGERVPVNVQAVVIEALQAVAASLPPGVRLDRELEGGNAAVMGDATQIHQVVMNLCANAVQAMRSSGSLCVGVQTLRLNEPLCLSTAQLEAGEYVKLTVRDTGSGIAPQVLDRIFDPFFTTKEVGVGTGLGLSLVHGIVTDLGGGIQVASTLGEGSTFTVYLPRQGDALAPVADDEPVVAGNGETILLVDDEEPLVRLGEESLAELGYEPVGFASSMAALEAFRTAPERFDAILSDESMPDLTGSELAREARRLRPDIPIVLMSGYVTPALAARTRDLGIADVLSKPLVARDIARALAAALRTGEEAPASSETV